MSVRGTNVNPASKRLSSTFLLVLAVLVRE